MNGEIMLENLFESVDEKVFTPAMKEKLTEAFNDAVEAKSHLIAEDMSAEIKSQLNEEAETYKQQLDEAFEQYADDFRTKLVENLNTYLSKIVDDFVNENASKINSLVKPYKADALLALFEKTTNIVGKDIADVIKPSNVNESTEIREHCNSLMSENSALKRELFDVKKAALCAEISESLTIPQTQAFKSLVEMNFKNLSDVEKSEMSLNDIEEKILSIKNNIEAVSNSKISESYDSLNESKLSEKVSRVSKVSKESPATWKRFV